MRRFGVPIAYPMGGFGMGSPLLTTLMAGGLGYALGSSSAQQAPPQAPPYQPYPYQAPPAPPQAPVSGADSGKLAQLKLLGDLYHAGMLTDDEFARQKKKILQADATKEATEPDATPIIVSETQYEEQPQVPYPQA